jgi:ubiquitin-conjugating enzyme E2 variant
MSSSSGYSYSRTHRALEIGGIAGLPVLLWIMLAKVAHGLDTDSPWLVPSVVAVVLGGYLAADFVSGLVHFLGDTYGDEDVKFFGPSFIKPFRVHHTDPQQICRHDFIELNGNNCLVCIPVGLVAYWLVPSEATNAGALGLLLVASLLVWVFMTNQFHKWAHDPEPPRSVAWLQSLGLVLSPAHHSIHHRAPYDRYYCITVGWLNPLLQRLHFFEAVRRAVAWCLPAQSPPVSVTTDPSDPTFQ